MATIDLSGGTITAGPATTTGTLVLWRPGARKSGTSASIRLAARMLANHGESAVLVQEYEGRRDDTGNWVPGTEERRTISLVTVPSSGRDRQMLPEGLRLGDVRRFYVRSADLLRDLDLGPSGAVRIEYGGTTYRVMMQQNFGAFHDIVAVRPEAQ